MKKMTILASDARDRLETFDKRARQHLTYRLTEAGFNALADYRDQLIEVAAQYAMQRGSHAVSADDLTHAQHDVAESFSIEVRRQ